MIKERKHFYGEIRESVGEPYSKPGTQGDRTDSSAAEGGKGIFGIAVLSCTSFGEKHTTNSEFNGDNKHQATVSQFSKRGG